MRITSIELAGTSNTTLGDGTPGLPRAFAKITRKRNHEFITVELIKPGADRVHHVQADCDEDLWAMAECLQYQLDGVKGTNSAIDEYFRELQRLAD